MIRLFRASLLLSVFVLTSACTTATKLNSVDRAATRCVAVQKTSYYPTSENIFYYTFGQNLTGAMGGAIGAGIAHAAAGGERQQFSAIFRNQKIDVGQIMTERFEQQLKRSGLFAVQGNPDANFRITILNMGAGIPNGLAIRMYPLLAVKAELVNKSGRTIWQKTDYVAGSHDSVQPGVLEDWQANPETLRQNFVACADRLSSALIAHLGQR